MVKITNVRTVLTIAISFGWDIRQLDVNNAFLNGNLEEVVYIRQPLGFVHPNYPKKVCKLQKVLYRLK